MSTVAQWDESPNTSVKDIINIFSQVLFCVPDVERGLGFIHDYTLSSSLGTSLALRWIWEEGFTNTIDKPCSAGWPVGVGGVQMLGKCLPANKEVTFQRCL